MTPRPIPAKGPLDIAVVDVEPPRGGAAFEVPGPGKQPRRAYLELSVSPAGLAARVMRGDREVQPLAVRVDDGEAPVSALPEAPLAVAARVARTWGWTPHLYGWRWNAA